MSKRLYEIVTIRKEERTYVIEAECIEDAEAEAMEGDAIPRSVDVLDELVHDSQDVTEDARDHDAENDAERDEVSQ